MSIFKEGRYKCQRDVSLRGLSVFPIHDIPDFFLKRRWAEAYSSIREGRKISA
jgi:hypothetical protein